MTLDEFRPHCNEWFGDFTVQCGDWEQIASPVADVRAALGDRAGGAVAAVERTAVRQSTLWAATTTGASSSRRTSTPSRPARSASRGSIRLAAERPNRFVSGISHRPCQRQPCLDLVQRVQRDDSDDAGARVRSDVRPRRGHCDLDGPSYDFGDIPITDVARDDFTGDLYASSDFGVFRLASGATTWTLPRRACPTSRSRA